MISEAFSLVYYDIICSLTQLNVGCKMNTLEYNNAFQLFIKPINIQDCLKSNRDRMLFMLDQLCLENLCCCYQHQIYVFVVLVVVLEC